MIRAFLAAAAAAIIAVGAPNTAMAITDEEPYSATIYGNWLSGQTTKKCSYTFENSSTSPDYAIWLVQLEVDEQTNVLKATAPEGWKADYTSTPHFVTWMHFDAETSPGILQGQAIEGFSAEFSVTPQYQYWSAMFNNISDPSECASDGGVVLIPAVAVPEPTGLMVFVVGLGALVRYRKMRA